MKTAKEILRKAHEKFSSNNPSDWKRFDEIMQDGTGEAMIWALKEYARQFCEEQKKICSKMVSGWPAQVKTESEIEEDILNAPLPELK